MRRMAKREMEVSGAGLYFAVPVRRGRTGQERGLAAPVPPGSVFVEEKEVMK